MSSRAIRVVLAGLTLAALAAGCGGDPPLPPAEGTVRGADGKPLANITVQFTPVEVKGAKVVSSTGVTGPDGAFALKADGGQPGAVAGKHKVVLFDNELSADEEPGGKAGKKTPVSRIPAAYLSAATTPLEVVVEAGAKHDLKVQPR